MSETKRRVFEALLEEWFETACPVFRQFALEDWRNRYDAAADDPQGRYTLTAQEEADYAALLEEDSLRGQLARYYRDRAGKGGLG